MKRLDANFRLVGGKLMMQVPPCFRGSGVVDGWKHVANVLEYESENPGLELLCPLGIDAVESICRALRAMKAVGALMSASRETGVN